MIRFVFLTSILLLIASFYHAADALMMPRAPSHHKHSNSAKLLHRSNKHADTVPMPRLEAIQQLLSLSASLVCFPISASAMYENAPVRPDSSTSSANANGSASSSSGPTILLPSGVTYEDLRPGTGDIIAEGKRVNIQWVLKRSNGYYVDSSERNDGIPFIFTVGGTTPKAIAGLDEGIRGMRVNGIRRIIIPPELSYVEGVEDDKPGPVPVGFGPKQRIRRVMELLQDVPGESILLDVKATRVQ